MWTIKFGLFQNIANFYSLGNLTWGSRLLRGKKGKKEQYINYLMKRTHE